MCRLVGAHELGGLSPVLLAHLHEAQMELPDYTAKHAQCLASVRLRELLQEVELYLRYQSTKRIGLVLREAYFSDPANWRCQALSRVYILEAMMGFVDTIPHISRQASHILSNVGWLLLQVETALLLSDVFKTSLSAFLSIRVLRH